MSVTPLVPRALLDRGYGVWPSDDGRWIAGHVDPKWGDHAATYGAYASPAEALAVIVYEARSTEAINARRR